MASATVENHLRLESLPLIDLRLLSQSELLALSLCSSSSPSPSLAKNDDDVLTPKIDRSVFNESAGSRKQTYSRLRLAPRNSSHSSFTTKTSTTPLPIPQFIDEENSQIISLFNSLFALQSHSSTIDDQHLIPVPIDYEDHLILPLATNTITNEVWHNVPVDIVASSETKRKRGRPRKNETIARAIERENRVIEIEDKINEAVVVPESMEEKEMVNVNRNRAVVDLVALGNVEDPFGEELRRRTEGMTTEAELLGFLSGLEGLWGSTRKKRRIVEASDFGDALPRGWKLMLCIKKRAGRRWLSCRRYISPNGQQFVSCKEVSSYLLSFFGLQDASQPNSVPTDDSIMLDDNLTLENAADLMLTNDKKGVDFVCQSPLAVTSLSTEHEKQPTLLTTGSPGEVQKGEMLKCHKCTMTFGEQDDLLHHLLSSHQSNAKRFRRSTSISDGVIIKDGEYECQFCHKLFAERHRYNGHLGVHMKNYAKRTATSSGSITVQRSIETVSVGAPPDVLKTQEPIGINRDSVARTSNAKPNHEISSGISNGKIQDIIVGTYLEKYSHEGDLLSHDEQAMKANRNDKTLVEENCNKQDRVCNISNDEVKQSTAMDPTTAKINVCSGAETFLFNNENSSIFESSGERNVLKFTTNGINNFVRQESSQNCSLAPSGCDEARVVDNNVNGAFNSSMEKHKRDIGLESGLLAPHGNLETLGYENIDDRLFSSTVEEMEVDDRDEVARNEPISGFGNSRSGLEDIVSNVKERRSSEDCLLLQSACEKRCGSINNVNGVSTSIMLESMQESGLPSSSVKQQCINNNLDSLHFSTLNEPNFGDDSKTGNYEQNVGFGNIHTVKKPWQETISEGDLLTLFGRGQSFGFKNNVNKVSPGSMEVPKLDEVRNSKNGELIPAVGGNDSGQDAGIVTSVEQEESPEGVLLVPSSNEQTSALNIYGVCGSILKELKQDRGSESSLLKPFCNEQIYDDENNVNKISSITLEEPKHSVKSSWIGNGRSGLGADVVTRSVNESFSDSSFDFSGNRQKLTCKNDVPGVCSSAVDEPKQRKGSVKGLFSLSGSEQACGAGNNLNRVYTGTVQEGPGLEDLENSRSNELMIGFGNHARPRESGMADLMWRTNEENVLLSGLDDTSSHLLQSSGYCPTFDIVSDKGETELFSVSEKYDNISSFEGQGSGSIEHTEYNFLTAKTSSHSEDSKVLSYDAEMAQGFDSPVWFDKEALPLLPKISSRHQVATVCFWCRSEFHLESVDSGGQANSMSILCATCKAKFSGQHNLL